MKTPVRVLIVDDCSTDREMLAEAISCEPTLHLAGCCSELHHAAGMLSTSSVDVILLSYTPRLRRPLATFASKTRRRPRLLVMAKTLIPAADLVRLIRHNVGGICEKAHESADFREIIRSVAYGGTWIDHPFLVALAAVRSRRSRVQSERVVEGRESAAPSSFPEAAGASPFRDLFGWERGSRPSGLSRSRRSSRLYPKCAARDFLVAAYMRAQADTRLPIKDRAGTRAAAMRARVERTRKALFEHFDQHACVGAGELL